MSFDLPRRSSFKGLPAIRRARGYRLYTASGERYLDLYQEAGRGILGSRPAGVGLRAKSVLDKLGTGSLPSVWEGRLVRLLAERFPEYPHVALCASLEEGLRRISAGEGSSAVWDPWEAGYGASAPREAEISLWRPWLPLPDCEFIVPVIPGAGSWGATIVAGRRPLPGDASPTAGFLVSAQYYAAELLFRRLDGEDTFRFAEFPTGPWERTGPYLFPRCGEGEYPRLVEQLLACGVYPSPEYRIPSIIPAEYDPGEVRALARKEDQWKSV